MKLVLAGDVMLGRLVNEKLRLEQAQYPWGDALPLFLAADWRFCNLECVLADRVVAEEIPLKVFNFRSDAKNVAVLEAARFDAVSLANNHSLDYGPTAFMEMLQILSDHGIAHSGAGRDAAKAVRASRSQIGDEFIDVVSFTDNEPEWEATLNAPGVNYAPVDAHDARAQRVLQAVAASKENCAFVIASAHWGGNWGTAPPADHIDFAHALIDAGADVVFGHSPHVFRGVEIYKTKPIIYSAGDFIDDYAVDPLERNDRSFVFEIEWGALRRLRLYPVEIRNFQAALANDPGVTATKMIARCEEFGTRVYWDDAARHLEILLACD